MISRIVGALVEPTPVVAEADADSLAIERNLVLLWRVFLLRIARRALGALRGLVKFQALVKGFLVKKRVAATLYSMQALLRAQLAIRSQRAQLAVRS
ncbi:hypothetical protein Tco_1126809 [Tanacetum coccineum]